MTMFMTEASPRMYGDSFRTECYNTHPCQLPKLPELEEDIQVEEDETSIRVTMKMEGVKGSDISVSVEHGILTIQGFRRSSMDGRKKQRLQRRFPVDTQVVDVSRAMANLWKDVLVLYAPKRSGAITIPVTEKPELEFVSPAAHRLGEKDHATQ